MKSSKLGLVVFLAVLIAGFFVFDLGQYFSLEYFKARQQAIGAYYLDNPAKSLLVYFFIYIAVTALSLPGAVILTLAGGAIFGLLPAFLVVSFASSIGATLAFLVSRYLLRDWVQGRFGHNLRSVNAGIEKEGAFYLFTLRLVPLFPFFVINLVMGLSTIRTFTFYWVSQLGMLAGTLVFVNAGTQIAKIDSLQGILSPALIGSFMLLGIFPFLAKRLIVFIKTRAVLSKYPMPPTFDRNIIVIGAGSGGLVTAYIAAAVKAKVTLIEKGKMGGECLNVGCVPSKALIRSAKFLAHCKRAKEFGFRSAEVEFDFAEVMERVQKVIDTVAPHDSIERYESLGVECLQGEARIVSPYEVEVNGQTLTTRSIVIATGSRPFIPKIPGIEKVQYLTSDTVWDLRVQPGRLLVLGGGPIGCELAQCFARLGSTVIQVQRNARLLPKEDEEFSDQLLQRFRAEGIDVRLAHETVEIYIEDDRKLLKCKSNGTEVNIEFDQVLVAIGRQAHTQGFGLEEIGVATTSRGTLDVNEYLQTSVPNVYACGDVVGPYQFTHAAAHQAWYCAVNALFGRFKKFKVDYSVIPWATFTDPEIARVGLNEQEADRQKIPYEVTRYGIDDLDRAIADQEAHGLVKVLTVPGKDKILGVTIAGEHAGDLIAEFVAAMRHGFGLNKILGTIHIYPTLAEANKYVAGNWKRAHAPQRILSWAERLHAWHRR